MASPRIEALLAQIRADRQAAEKAENAKAAEEYWAIMRGEKIDWSK